MPKPKGFLIEVPVTLGIAVRGASAEDARRIARDFAQSLDPSHDFVIGYSEGLRLPGVSITEATLGCSSEDFYLLEPLDEEEEDATL